MTKYSTIVWDGKTFTVPEGLGKPREDQLASTWLDNLAELAGRTCYDSLGTGRKSTEYHKHIIDVGHGSVQEHPNLTFLFPGLSVPDYLSCCESMLNRPGVWSVKNLNTPSMPLVSGNLFPPKTSALQFDLRITANMRAIREWFKQPLSNKWTTLLGETLQNLAKDKAPLLFCDIPKHDVGLHNCTVVEPEHDEELWISMFITNVSRGFSHELVRHKYMTAVSQRSTRYVDENASPWVWHPLIHKHNEEFKGKGEGSLLKLEYAEEHCKRAYAEAVEVLQKYMIDKGTDKFTARKQARGAARGVLGNALLTEMIFSANITEWKWMMKLRASRHADAEIRVVFNEIFELLSERFPDRFQGWTKEACPDGIGYELKGP